MWKKIKKIIYISTWAAVILIILISFTHSKKHIFNRTRFVYAGRGMSINEVREKAYGFYGGKNTKETTEKMGKFWEKIFTRKIIGEDKKKEKEVLDKGEIFFDCDFSGGQAWVSKQASFFTPTFYYFALYEYQNKYYVQMQFAMYTNRESYSSMFRFKQITNEEVNKLKECGSRGIEGNGQKEIEERNRRSAAERDATNMNPTPPR